MKFVVDVYRTLAQTVEIEAATEDEAEELAVQQLSHPDMWDTEQLTDDIETAVVGTVDENGERQYNC